MQSGLRTAGIVMLAAGALLCGCTMGPDYKRPDLPLPTTWRTGIADMADAADLANTDWWHAFGDADLDRLIDEAIDANLDLKVAAFRIDSFEARLAISRGANYPTFGYGASVGRERRSQERPNGLQPGQSPTFSNYEIGATFSWELDLWGKVRRSNEAAVAELLSSQEGRRGVMLSVVSGVASSYIHLVELDRQMDLARQVLKNREDTLALLDAKFRGGSATRLQVEQARATVEADAAKIPLLQGEIETQENALSPLLGRNSASIQRRSLESLALPQMPQGVPVDVLARRPDVKAAEQDLVAANARIGIAKTAYFPTLSLSALFGVGADDLRWLWAEDARTGNITSSITGPLFAGGKIDAAVRQAEAQQKESAVHFRQTVLTALREVDDAIVARTKSGQHEAAVGRQVNSLQEVSRLARARYEGGQSTYVDVLSAELSLYAGLGGQAASRRDTLLALVSIYKAMGGGWMVEQEKRRAPAAADSVAQAQPTSDVEAPK